MSAPTNTFLKMLTEHKSKITQFVPWAQELDFEITDVDAKRVYARQPYHDKLIGDPETGVIASGVVTTLLDSISGIACGVRLGDFRAVATLDLRIDYMRPAEPGDAILAYAECYHVTRSICFTRAVAYHGDEEKIIASAAGAFAITAPPKPPKTN